MGDLSSDKVTKVQGGTGLLEPGHKPHKGPGDGNGQGLFAGSTPVDNSVAWGGKVWMTATLHAKGGAPCACPSGCVDCAYRSPHLYNNTNMNWRPLYNGSTPTELRLQGAAGRILWTAPTCWTPAP